MILAGYSGNKLTIKTSLKDAIANESQQKQEKFNDSNDTGITIYRLSDTWNV